MPTRQNIISVIMILIIFSSYLSATKYAGEIFAMGASVRSYALGGVGISDHKNTALAYWNPALLSKVETNKIEIMHAEEYAGLLSYDVISLILGKRDKYALTLARIGIDDIPLTKWNEVTDRPYVYDSVNNSDYILYLGLSREMGKFELGITPKFVYRYLAKNSGYGFGLDLSTYYELNKQWLLAAKVNDIFTSQIFWKDGEHEFVNPSFKIETNYDFIIPYLNKKSTFFLGSDIFAESREEASNISLSILSFDFHSGLEIAVRENINFLLGFDKDNFTGGIGLLFKKWRFNYAFEQDSDLDNSHRISLGINL